MLGERGRDSEGGRKMENSWKWINADERGGEEMDKVLVFELNVKATDSLRGKNCVGKGHHGGLHVSSLY
jgi:hypothetical protein